MLAYERGRIHNLLNMFVPVKYFLVLFIDMSEKGPVTVKTAPFDPRFPNQNQTR